MRLVQIKRTEGTLLAVWLFALPTDLWLLPFSSQNEGQSQCRRIFPSPLVDQTETENEILNKEKH